MRRISIVAVMLMACSLAVFVSPHRSSFAARCPSGMRCGSYTIHGLGARKQQVIRAGATVLDLAIAMLETETMQTNYTYGDGKTGDSANFGIFKQNWFLLRTSCTQFSGQSSSQYKNGSILNSDLSEDVACINRSQGYYGTNIWFAGLRDGQTGVNNPNTKDINNYEIAIYWIQNQLKTNQAALSNDTRYWVYVPAI